MERAADVFERLLGEPASGYGTKIASVRYSLAYIRMAQARFAESEELLGHVGLEAYESPNLRGAVAVALARLYFAWDAFEPAAAWASSIRDDGTWVMDEIRYIEGVSLYRSGHPAEGREVLQDALPKCQRPDYAEKMRDSLIQNP
jgi:hypothetical protein